jgi:signal transduction histidine kinase
MRLDAESPIVGNLHKIQQSAARAADIAKQMLAYSGKGKFIVEHINLNRLLEEMLRLLEVSIAKKTVLCLNLQTPIPTMLVDVSQMRQIITNMVINASEAIGEQGGMITLSTGCIACDRDYLKDVWLEENMAEGDYVWMEVADTGCGMDEETVSKIFDPFFTTKFTGRGLGLAAVLGIVRGHHGAIKVHSEQGKGSVFKVLLPCSGNYHV